MQAITKLNANDPVIWSDMNNKFGEIEARDAELDNKINDLNYDRGYLNTLGTRFSEAIKNGKYIVSNDTDCPDGSTESTWLIDVTQMNDSYVLQEAFCLYSPIGNTGKKYTRYSVNIVWQPWERTTTATKTSFSCSAKTGYTIVSQNCYTLNGMAYINIAIKKVDGSVFDSVQHALFTSPYYSTSLHYPINAVFTNGPLVGGFAYNGAIWTDGGCYITLTGNTATQINIHAEVPL